MPDEHSTAPPLVGISLQADAHFLALNRDLIENDAAIYEVNPETLWAAGCVENPLHPVFREIVERSGRPTIGHGILYSLAAATPPRRRKMWLEALRRDQRAFRFEWFSEHLGFADHGDLHLALPLPVPRADETVDAVARNFEPLQEIFTTVAFENNVSYFAVGDPLDEPLLFADVCERTGCGMVLDLHNAYTTCLNFELDLDEWLSHVPLHSVIEIHVSGGSPAGTSWFQSSRRFRLDTHDQSVPEPVWELLAATAPKCPALRAVIVEWLPDDMDKAAASAFASDVHRARSLVC